MARLVYKTRGMVSPQGKPRVYFCCHPQDFEECFAVLSEEILERQNCAIWYDGGAEETIQGEACGEANQAESTEEKETYWEDLKEMQLFVVPVTARLLAGSCRARDEEIPFAIEYHIPLLPIMMEPGLEKQYEEIFGDLQFLDRQKDDPTAIEYGEKLDAFLAAVLVGDELAEKVRKAFDAYVFLSYRKKDRTYAKQLMRLIHQNDFCRDIAIWYDEFLRPGEDFNDAIGEALQKSHLFVLTVTPSLVSEMNYIRTVEYPLAKQEKKPILPVEMIPTDRQALSLQYEDIPPCADGGDREAFSDLLAEALTGIALREKDSSPEHRFFIGLAYLGGIDVEVDHQRALSLISSAAEEGLEEAMNKLVTMYRNGEGVARDYVQAVKWQEVLVMKVKSVYDKEETEENALRCIKEYRNLAEYLYELRQVDRSMEFYHKAVELGEKIQKSWDHVEVREQIALAYDAMGNIRRAEEMLKEAVEYYEKALGLREQILDKVSSVKNRRAVAVSCYRLGEYYRIENEYEKSAEFYGRQQALILQLAKEDTATDWRRDLMISYGALGDLEVAQHRYDAGIEYLKQGLKIAREMEAEHSTTENRKDLSIACDKMGFACRWSGRLEQAEEYYRESDQISRHLLKEDPTFDNKKAIAISHYNLGELYLAQDKVDQAEREAQAMISLTTEMSEETGSIEARKYLTTAYHLMGDVCRKMTGWDEAMKYYRQAEVMLRQLAEETGDAEVLAAMK